MKRVIDDPRNWFAALGGLHDSIIESFEWDAANRTIVIKIDDLFANFRETDQEVGSLAAALGFLLVSSVEVIANPVVEKLWIYDVETRIETDRSIITLRLAPHGHIQIACSRVELDTQSVPSARMLFLLESCGKA